jgi:alpha/beta superfamily hydrolase
VRAYDLAEADDPWAGAVLLHPHPDMGGDRYNNVVDALFQQLPVHGVSALRFDFTSSDLDDAVADTTSALDRMTTAPCFLVGYSFGGGVAATITDVRIAGWYLVAPALTMFEPAIGDDPRPKAIAAAEHDRFFSPVRLEIASADWTATDRSTITGADHMFVGRTDEVVKQCLAWLRGRVTAAR